MTDAEINVAVAEALGWKNTVASFCHDLNAMFEAEKIFVGTRDWKTFKSNLQCEVKASGGTEAYYCHATAKQRAIAFLKTLNKWRETEAEIAKG